MHRRIMILVLFAPLLTLGCGNGKPEYSLVFNPLEEAWPSRDRPGKGSVVLRIGKPGDTSWSGRKVKVTIQTDADLTVEPAEKEVELDQSGQAEFTFTYTAKELPAKDNEGHKLTITAIGPEKFNASLPGEVYVRKEPAK